MPGSSSTPAHIVEESAFFSLTRITDDEQRGSVTASGDGKTVFTLTDNNLRNLRNLRITHSA